MTTLREKLIKIGAKVVRPSKYVMFQLAEVAVPSRRTEMAGSFAPHWRSKIIAACPRLSRLSLKD